MNEVQNLIEMANEAYLAFYAALAIAPVTPEIERLRLVNDRLKQAIIHARNATKVRKSRTTAWRTLNPH